MTELIDKILRFWRSQSGSLAIWFAFLVPFFIGVLGLAVEGGRLYMAKTRLQLVADRAALIAANNEVALSNADVIQLMNAYVTTELLDLNGLSFVRIENLQIQTSWSNTATMPKVRVSLTGKLPLTLLKVLDFGLPFTVMAQADAQLVMDPTDIVLVLDRSIAAGGSKLSAVAAGGGYLSEKLSLLQSYGADIRLGVLPGSGTLVNIAPRINWLEPGVWPADNLPPFVPGVVTWTGALSQQRWCVGPREGELASALNLPSVDPFPLMLTINKLVDEAGVDTYSIVKNAGCPEDRVRPLTSTLAAMPQFIQNLSTVPSFNPERGIVWANRLLEESWSEEWGNSSVVVQERRKIILFLMGGSVANNWAGALDFQSNCAASKARDVAINIIDFTVQATLQGLNRECAEPSNYRDVSSVDEFNTALADFLKSLARPILLRPVTAF